jgi:hypothetical protein
MFEIRDITRQHYDNHYAGEKVDTSTDVPVVAHPASVTDDTRASAPEREPVGAQ